MIWAPVGVCKGFDFGNKYLVSDTGLVKSISKGALISQRPHNGIVGEHFSVNLYDGLLLRGTGKNCITMPVHRLVALVFIPNPEGLPIVMHKDNNKQNNNSNNLKWGTTMQNSQDARRDGLYPEVNPNAKGVIVTGGVDHNQRVYTSMAEAAKDLGGNATAMRVACRRDGKYKSFLLEYTKD